VTKSRDIDFFDQSLKDRARDACVGFFFRLMALVRRADGEGTDFGPIQMGRGISGDGGVSYNPIKASKPVLAHS
jgi:hypothetical protein